jgi:hypothetical protein
MNTDFDFVGSVRISRERVGRGGGIGGLGADRHRWELARQGERGMDGNAWGGKGN